MLIGVHRNQKNLNGNRNRSFTEVVIDKRTEVASSSVSQLSYSSSVADKDRLRKAYVWKVKILGSTYGMQTKLKMEGYYNVKVTLLGESLCLLEENESGVIDNFISEGDMWWKNCFEKVFKW